MLVVGGWWLALAESTEFYRRTRKYAPFYADHAPMYNIHLIYAPDWCKLLLLYSITPQGSAA